jgi:hypothetical protein
MVHEVIMNVCSITFKYTSRGREELEHQEHNSNGSGNGDSSTFDRTTCFQPISNPYRVGSAPAGQELDPGSSESAATAAMQV